MSTNFDADSSSHVPFRAQTDRQTRLDALPHASGYTAGVGIKTKAFLLLTTRSSFKHHENITP